MFTQALLISSLALGSYAELARTSSSSSAAFAQSSAVQGRSSAARGQSSNAFSQGSVAPVIMTGASSSPATSASPVVAQTTMALFIDGGKDEGYVGSIVSADSCETTIALYCTEGSFGSGLLTATCDPSQSALATYGPSFYELSTQISTLGVVATLSESCSLAGTTEAVCVASLSAAANGQHTASVTTTTKSGNEVNIFQVPITAGASKVKGLAACTSTANAAAPTGAIDVVKVLVVPGAAALLAGIQAMA